MNKKITVQLFEIKHRRFDLMSLRFMFARLSTKPLNAVQFLFVYRPLQRKLYIYNNYFENTYIILITYIDKMPIILTWEWNTPEAVSVPRPRIPRSNLADSHLHLKYLVMFRYLRSMNLGQVYSILNWIGLPNKM